MAAGKPLKGAQVPCCRYSNRWFRDNNSGLIYEHTVRVIKRVTTFDDIQRTNVALKLKIT